MANAKLRQRETQLQKLITDWLTLAGIGHTVTDAALVVTEDGQKRESSVVKSWPDITGYLPQRRGRMFVIEVKTPEGRFSDGQVERLADMEREGVFVLRPRSLREVVVAFEDEYISDDRSQSAHMFLLFRAVAAYYKGFGAG